MADNIAVTPGTGATIAADSISSVLYQRVKIIQGADGVNDGDVSTANPLPVVQTGTPGLPTGAATAAKQDTGNNSLSSIDGKVTACNTGAVTVSSSALPSGAATSAKQDTGNTSLSSIDGKVTACNTGAVTVSSSALPSGAATSTKQSDGSQKTQVVDGSGNVIGATSNALDINIKSGNPTTIAVTQGTATNLKAQAECYQGGSAVASGNPLQVTLANGSVPSHAVTNAGTFAVQNTPAIGGGQTLLNYTGTNSASGDLIAADGAKSIYVVAYSLITSDTTGTTITFQDNASTSIWAVTLQAITGTVSGANLATTAPSYLFSVASGHKLSCLNSGSKAVLISLTYFKV